MSKDKHHVACIPLELLEAYEALTRAVEDRESWLIIASRAMDVRNLTIEHKDQTHG
jgi:hypothetical protein